MMRDCVAATLLLCTTRSTRTACCAASSMWSAAFANAPPLHPYKLTAAPSSWRSCNDWRHRANPDLVRVGRFHSLGKPVRLGLRQQPESGGDAGGDAGESGREEDLHGGSRSSPVM